MPDIDPVTHPHLYRAIRSKRWLRQKSAGFRLRENEASLSVLLSAHCTKLVCDAGLNECYGEFVLNTTGVQGLGLQVRDDEPDDPRYSTNHGNIIGLPPFGSDEQTVEDMASDLSDLIDDTRRRPA